MCLCLFVSVWVLVRVSTRSKYMMIAAWLWGGSVYGAVAHLAVRKICTDQEEEA